MSRGFGKKKTEESDNFVFNLHVVENKLKTWFPDLTVEQLAPILFYAANLVKFNNSLNLISQSSIRNMESVHIGDAILGSRLLFPKLVPNQPVYDFGSGNGIPGLVFGVLYPQIPVVLLDRDQRKMEFCKHVVAGKNLNNISVKIGAIEDLGDGSVFNALSRGFAPLPRALMATRKVIARGGKYFHFKGDGWANELASMPSQLFSYWTPSLLGQYRLPDTNTDMSLVLTEKTAE